MSAAPGVKTTKTPAHIGRAIAPDQQLGCLLLWGRQTIVRLSFTRIKKRRQMHKEEKNKFCLLLGHSIWPDGCRQQKEHPLINKVQVCPKKKKRLRLHLIALFFRKKCNHSKKATSKCVGRLMLHFGRLEQGTKQTFFEMRNRKKRGMCCITARAHQFAHLGHWQDDKVVKENVGAVDDAAQREHDMAVGVFNLDLVVGHVHARKHLLGIDKHAVIVVGVA